jgi:phosphatidylglycerol:prolipoprotein diacylglycerol transferase
MFPVLQIGSLALRLPGLFLIVGLWLSTLLIDREAPRRGQSAGAINSMVFYALIGGLIGARLGYALRYLDAYLSNPLALVSLSPSTLSILEGFVMAGIVALAYAQRKGLSLWPTLDALTPSFALFAIFLGAAHLSSGDAFGAEAQVPWAIDLWGARRHPSQVYEILAAVLIFLGVWRIRVMDAFSGFLSMIWLSLAAAARLLLEGFRGDSVIVFGGLRFAQLTSLVILLLSLAMLHVLSRRQPTITSPSTPN